jgi:hypothetical protein
VRDGAAFEPAVSASRRGRSVEGGEGGGSTVGRAATESVEAGGRMVAGRARVEGLTSGFFGRSVVRRRGAVPAPSE